MSGRMRALMPAMALAMVGAAGVPDAAPSKAQKPSRGRGEGARLMDTDAFERGYYRGIGNAIRSRKRDVRRSHGTLTGRQWRKLRKSLRSTE
jgi:hypothetical protein